MKVVINSDYGGFSLSDKAIRDYAQRKGITLVEKEDRFGNTLDRKSTRLNSSHVSESRMPSSA